MKGRRQGEGRYKAGAWDEIAKGCLAGLAMGHLGAEAVKTTELNWRCVAVSPGES